MKIGITASSMDKFHGRWGTNAYLKLKEQGFSCSDFNISETGTPIYTLPEEEADKILIAERKLAEAAGIEISQVHGPWRWPPKDDTPEDLKERMEKMKRSIRATAVIGCKNWVVHPIMPFGIEDIPAGKSKETWEMNLSFMTELLKTAKEYDVTICLENMPMLQFSLATPEKILEFVRQMNDDHFKICLDTGHVSVFPDLVLADEVRRLGDEIRVLHVHDNNYGRDAHMFPCFGINDWKSFGKALKDIGFSGSFSLETRPPMQLPDQIFEKLSISLREIAEWILE
ncbi:MAG: sugar phosphate isomerase/epimerase [Clostridia bacterium]|nr:sugar phosphate isomerase/epimerase [Clostridia bacterium]